MLASTQSSKLLLYIENIDIINLLIDDFSVVWTFNAAVRNVERFLYNMETLDIATKFVNI